MEHKNESFRQSKLLAFDFGSKRIGLALWDVNAQMARVLPILHRTTLKKDLIRIEAIISENQIEALVVGLPIALSGAHTASTENSKFWISTLREKFPQLKSYFVDESLSTGRALEKLQHLGPEKRAEIKDSVAAAILLEDFLREGPLEEDY